MKVTKAVWLSFFLSCPVFANGYFYNMVINYTPNPASCSDFINSGALYMDVNPGLPDTQTGGPTQALVNNNYTVALLNAHPGYTVVVPRLREDVFCSAKCAIANLNCWKACKFAVSNFYSVQTPTYTVPNGTIFVKCPTLNMSKYPNYPGDPYNQFPYNR
ncbi:MAG: hypothetical protein JSR33_13970 [Proteobacteria bacterium]|nr:hypothetical protein [Pseudomonadota bacterium]